MSRIGQAPITVPAGVDVNIVGTHITVKGPKGSLDREIPGGITIDVDGDTLTCVRSLVNNMVLGVTEGFKKELQIVGVGYRAEAQGKDIRLSLGFSHTIDVKAPEGISFELPAQTQVIVSGIDKEVVGQVAANIRSLRKPEPYKGKGVRYLGERVVRKAGKAGKK